MSKSKTNGKDKKKSAQLVLRVEKAERDDFVALCERLDTTAAREIRRFMRDLVASHEQTTVVTEAQPVVAAPTPEPAIDAVEAAVPVTAPQGPTAATEPVKRKRRTAA
jgi:hypothetical protein